MRKELRFFEMSATTYPPESRNVREECALQSTGPSRLRETIAVLLRQLLQHRSRACKHTSLAGAQLQRIQKRVWRVLKKEGIIFSCTKKLLPILMLLDLEAIPEIKHLSIIIICSITFACT